MNKFEASFKALEKSFRHQKNTDKKADALVEAPYFHLVVKKRMGTEFLDLWVTPEKIAIQKNDKFTKIEGNYTEGIKIFLKGLY